MKSGSAHIMARSSSPICDGPSSPMDTPQCVPTSFKLSLLMAAMRMKSYARVTKHENKEATGTLPRAASPMAIPTMFCSAM